MGKRLSPAFIVDALRKGSGQSAARTLSADDRAIRIATQFGGMIEHPLPTCLAVIQARRKRMLGRKPILGGNNRDPELFDHSFAELIIEVGSQPE